MKRAIGLSLAYPYLNSDFYYEMARAGVTMCEISVKFDEYPLLDYRKIAAETAAAGVKLWSFHYPFSPFKSINIASLDSDVRLSSVAYLSELTRKASDIGISRFVIHASGEPNKPEDREELLKRAGESLETLSAVAASCGAVIAVEDLPRTCLGNCHEEILRLIGENPTLGVCFDSNHLLSERGEDFLSAVAHRLVTVHISDYDFIDERHWLPGEGKINWNSMMDAIDSVGYQGTFLYELSFGSTRTISRPCDLTPADFAQNAKELSERLTLTKRGTPLV